MAALLPQSVSLDSTNSRQHRGLLANAVNSIIRWLAALTTANLGDYETGTWTPTDVSGAGLAFASAAGTYVRVGFLVFFDAVIIYPITSNTDNAKVSLPFTAGANARDGAQVWLSTGVVPYWVVTASAATFSWETVSGSAYTNSNLSGTEFKFSGCYQTGI